MAIYSYQYGEDIAAYEQAGAERAYVAPGTQSCWMDTSPELGFMVEIMSANPVFDGFFAKIRAAADNWVGREPIRELAGFAPARYRALSVAPASDSHLTVSTCNAYTLWVGAASHDGPREG